MAHMHALGWGYPWSRAPLPNSFLSPFLGRDLLTNKVSHISKDRPRANPKPFPVGAVCGESLMHKGFFSPQSRENAGHFEGVRAGRGNLSGSSRNVIAAPNLYIRPGTKDIQVRAPALITPTNIWHHPFLSLYNTSNNSAAVALDAPARRWVRVRHGLLHSSRTRPARVNP